jgi:hypothetical protein
MNSGVLAKSLAKSLSCSVFACGLTTLLLSWTTVSSARPTLRSSSALSTSLQQASGGCKASSKAISASNWQISAPREPNLTKPDEIVQIGLRNSENNDVNDDRVVARVVAPDGSLAAAYPIVNGDRHTHLTYPLDFSEARPTQAGTYTVVLEVNGQSVLCDRFVVAKPNLIDTAFDNDLTGRKLELHLEKFLNSNESVPKLLLLASKTTNPHNRLFPLSSPPKPVTDNLKPNTDNLLSPDPNPIVKETASSDNSSISRQIGKETFSSGNFSSKSASCLSDTNELDLLKSSIQGLMLSFNLSNLQDEQQEQQSSQDLEEPIQFQDCQTGASDYSTDDFSDDNALGSGYSDPSATYDKPGSDAFGIEFPYPVIIPRKEIIVTKVVEPSSLLALLFLTTLTWMVKKKN